jgi:hypothetical protein
MENVFLPLGSGPGAVRNCDSRSNFRRLSSPAEKAEPQKRHTGAVLKSASNVASTRAPQLEQDSTVTI